MTDAAAPAANWGGLVGHWLASTLMYVLGGGAFVLVGVLWQAVKEEPRIFAVSTVASPASVGCS